MGSKTKKNIYWLVAKKSLLEKKLKEIIINMRNASKFFLLFLELKSSLLWISNEVLL